MDRHRGRGSTHRVAVLRSTTSSIALPPGDPITLGEVPDEARDSAVLCVLYETHDGPHVLLTRRSPTMRHHAHEISFPGGRRDDTDPDLWSTALREAEEEVALDRRRWCRSVDSTASSPSDPAP